MEKIYIFGHQKPDTDSVTSAITLSYLKNKLGYNTEPRVLGEVNNETKYVLNYFNVKTPRILDDVKLQIKDLNYHKNIFIKETSTIKEVYDYMINKGITGTPIVDNNQKFVGLITVKNIVKHLISNDLDKLNTSFENILKTLDGEDILHFDDEIRGDLLVAAYRSTTILNSISFDNNTILIVGDRHSVIEYAVKNGVKLLIVVGGNEIKEEHLELARENHVNIIRTNLDTFHTAKLVGLSNYISNIIPSDRPHTFDENYYYDDFVVKTNKLKHNNYPVIGKNGICKGLIRITEITEKNKKKVILVDHNEFEQSAEGLNEAEIIEVVDHHKIGDISTNSPINFRIMTVGSTNTIIYQLYLENNVTIPIQIAGLMLSGILSDTLALTSPTTTAMDKQVVTKLSEMLNIDYHTYALNMFKAGTSLKGKTLEEIVTEDIKTFQADDVKFAVSQIFTLNYENILNNIDKYIDYIEKIANDRDYKLVVLLVTDIIKNGSYILYTKNDQELLANAFSKEDLTEGMYFDGIVSRKKQVVPKIMEVIH